MPSEPFSRHEVKMGSHPSWNGQSMIVLGRLLLLLILAAGPASAQVNLEVDGNAVDPVPGVPEDWDVVLGWSDGVPVAPSGSAAQYRFQTDPLASTVITTSAASNTADFDAWKWGDAPVAQRYELLDAAAASYDDGEFYFAADRYGSSGDWYFGLWLLQNPQGLADSTFTQKHAVGDVLVLVDSQFGPVTTAVYRWVGDGSGSNGNLDNITSWFTSADLAAVANGATECSPWPFTAAFPATCSCTHCFPANTFLEGYLNLGVVGSPCIQSLLFLTYATPSLTSAIRDFVLVDYSCQPSGVTPSHSQGLLLGPPFPNPFSRGTRVHYVLAREGPVSLEVFSVSGRRVRSWPTRVFPAGEGEMSWDGRDDRGSQVAPGVYLMRATTREGVSSRRVMKLD